MESVGDEPSPRPKVPMVLSSNTDFEIIKSLVGEPQKELAQSKA